jgi:serine/threonine protein kinase
MARFQREAKVLASLNHHNIATVHGLEDSGSMHALVMELVAGPTLAERIGSGPIPVGEALPIAKQMCAALEYAHERGIVHRDLKPANVKVTRDDVVKVLDCGLAKALEGDAASIDLATSPTITRMPRRREFCWARRRTCRQSRRWATRWIGGPTSGRSLCAVPDADRRGDLSRRVCDGHSGGGCLLAEVMTSQGVGALHDPVPIICHMFEEAGTVAGFKFLEYCANLVFCDCH